MTHDRITVIIADDHFLVREGLRASLEKCSEFMVAGEASNGKELIELVGNAAPNVVLTDIKMPYMDGITATRLIKKISPSTAIVALSFMDNLFAVVEMLEAGALGYLNKTASIADIIEAVRKVNAGLPYYCSSTTAHLEKQIAQSEFNPYKNFKPEFTEQQARIIRMISKGMSSKEISERLAITVRTVEAHRRNILEHLQLKSTAGIVIYAIKKELISLEELP